MVGTPHSLKPSYRERAACGPHIVNTCRVSQVVVNSEDTLIAPGDSSREGNAVMLPVVGIRRSDAARLLDGEEASISYQPIVHLTNEQRKHLRAVVIMRNKDGALATMKLDQGVASEFLLDEIEEMLSRDELVRVQVPSPTLPFPPRRALLRLHLRRVAAPRLLPTMRLSLWRLLSTAACLPSLHLCRKLPMTASFPLPLRRRSRTTTSSRRTSQCSSRTSKTWWTSPRYPPTHPPSPHASSPHRTSAGAGI